MNTHPTNRIATAALVVALVVWPLAALAAFTADVVVPGRGERVTVDQAYIVTDTSGSVDGAGQYRPEKQLVEAFTAGMPDGSYAAGAVAFGGGKRFQQNLASFHRANLTGWASGIPSFRDSTPLRWQLKRVAEHLEGAGGRAAVIVFSDGEPNLYGAPDAEGSLAAAKEIAAKHGGQVCIYPVQVGGGSTGTNFMQALAKVTGCGAYRSADSISNTAGLHGYQREIFLGRGAAPKPGDADGDGVLDPDDRCPGTPRGARVDGRGCWTIRGLNFDTNKADIKPEFEARLNEVVSVLKNAPGVRIRVDGHTDSRGSDSYNQQLSQRRAQAVADYFVRRGVDRGRLAVKGFGESAPVAPNDTPANMYQNRRTELSVID